MGRLILVVDDDRTIVNMININLKKNGYETICAYDGEAGLEMALTKQPDLVLLDVMMPKMNGDAVCRKIREKSDVPIIMITANATEEIDIVFGLEIGADDYVTKPFKPSIRVLMAKVKANLRRQEASKTEDKNGGAQQFGDFVVDTSKYEVMKNGEPVRLTNKEYELFYFLATHANQVFTRDELLEKVWGYEYFGVGDGRNVDVAVRRLREKIEPGPEPKYIISKRGKGYYFDLP